MADSFDASMGAQSTLSMNAVSYPFVSESLTKQGQHIERAGIRGTRSHDVDDVREGPYTVGGSVVIEPTVAEFMALLTLAMGGAALVETVSAFTTIIDRIAGIHTCVGCKIDKFTLSSQAGQLCKLNLDIIGLSSTITGSAPSEPASSSALQHSDLTLTIGGSARSVSSLTFTLDNVLIGGRFMNNLTVPSIPESDRIITVSAEVPYNATNADLYTTQSLSSSATGSLLLDDDTSDCLLTFAILQMPPESPNVGGKGEVPLLLNMTARKDGATLELVMTDPA